MVFLETISTIFSSKRISLIQLEALIPVILRISIKEMLLCSRRTSNIFDCVLESTRSDKIVERFGAGIHQLLLGKKRKVTILE